MKVLKNSLQIHEKYQHKKKKKGKKQVESLLQAGDGTIFQEVPSKLNYSSLLWFIQIQNQKQVSQQSFKQ